MAPRAVLAGSILLAGSFLAGSVFATSKHRADSNERTQGCRSDPAITLPPGFCATIFADNLGPTRHLVVGPDGIVYVNSWTPASRIPPPPGGLLIALRDADGDGRADQINRFGPGVEQHNNGGTGIALYNGALYAEWNDKIVRYALAPGEVVPRGEPTVILSGMPTTGDHPMHPFAIDAKGNLFVNMGSATNACELKNRQFHSKGHEPCTELETRAGLWRYDANRTGQMFSPAERFATGIRNAGGIAFDSTGRMFATQHGRDQLSQNWPELYTTEQGAELPAEELLAPESGADFGWPRCYYDGFQKKLVLAPDYGGDGGKTTGLCAQKRGPVAGFPAHWAPNDLLIYTGDQFPRAYRGGAFIAFHGSWNRAPAPQDGYRVVFQPIANAQASGPYLNFADGFAGGIKDPGRAAHRPAGLAMGPDGALYVSDDVRGRIWRITYSGRGNAPLTAAAAPTAQSSTAATRKPAQNIPTGYTAQQVVLGDRIFHGKARGGTCSGCHGSDGKGTPVGPSLADSNWLWGNGSVASIARVVVSGVPQPKKYNTPMPAKGGAQLNDADVRAVAAYVWTLSHAR